MSSLPVTEADLQAYVDDRLPASRVAEVDAWLAERPEEAARVAAYREQNAMLHALFDPVLAEPVPERLLPRNRKRAWPALRQAAAVGWLAIGGLIGWGVQSYVSTQAPDGLARRAAVAHTVFAPDQRRAVEIKAEDEAALVTWLTKRMGQEIRVPKLVGAGYQLLGGRLLPGERGPACQLMYQDGEGKRMTVYMTRDQDASVSATQRYLTQGALGVVQWAQGALRLAVIGEANEKELRRVSLLVRDELPR